jgi:hypothetical protein
MALSAAHTQRLSCPHLRSHLPVAIFQPAPQPLQPRARTRLPSLLPFAVNVRESGTILGASPTLDVRSQPHFPTHASSARTRALTVRPLHCGRSPPSIAMVSILFLVLGDMSAAIIGVSFGGETCGLKRKHLLPIGTPTTMITSLLGHHSPSNRHPQTSAPRHLSPIPAPMTSPPPCTIQVLG